MSRHKEAGPENRKNKRRSAQPSSLGLRIHFRFHSCNKDFHAEKGKNGKVEGDEVIGGRNLIKMRIYFHNHLKQAQNNLILLNEIDFHLSLGLS